MPQKYKLLKDREIRGELCAKAGTTVYEVTGYDYGLARDDSVYSGIPHISVTLDATGGYPSFTVPTCDLEKIEEATQ